MQFRTFNNIISITARDGFHKKPSLIYLPIIKSINKSALDAKNKIRTSCSSDNTSNSRSLLFEYNSLCWQFQGVQLFLIFVSQDSPVLQQIIFQCSSRLLPFCCWAEDVRLCGQDCLIYAWVRSERSNCRT